MLRSLHTKLSRNRFYFAVSSVVSSWLWGDDEDGNWGDNGDGNWGDDV
jgi:hypothetical protein